MFCKHPAWESCSHCDPDVVPVPRVYVASSFRNPIYRTVMDALKGAGFDVFEWDVKHVELGYTEFDKTGKAKAIRPELISQSCRDAIRAADLFVMVMPCGSASHIEYGYYLRGSNTKLYIIGEDKEHMDDECFYCHASKHAITDLDAMIKEMKLVTGR